MFRIGAEEGEEINEDVVNTLFAEAGDDTVYIGGGYNQVIGGEEMILSTSLLASRTQPSLVIFRAMTL